jgi:hypothetical protein
MSDNVAQPETGDAVTNTSHPRTLIELAIESLLILAPRLSPGFQPWEPQNKRVRTVAEGAIDYQANLAPIAA